MQEKQALCLPYVRDTAWDKKKLIYFALSIFPTKIFIFPKY